MMKGIYTPLSGAIAQEKVLEIIANNLANVNTTGFKGENVTFTLLEPEPEKMYRNPLPPANYKVKFEDMMPLIGNEHAYVGVSGVTRDLTQGSVVRTGNPTDLAIHGEGFFVVQTPQGERFTRDGSFKLSPNGTLVTQQDHPVLGEKGNIVLRSGQFQVNTRGEIYKDGQLVDKLQIFRVEKDEALEKVGNNYFLFGGVDADKQKVLHPNVNQGQLEASNVNAMKNLTAMIMTHRAYEAYQKAVGNFDTMMDKSANTIGEVRA